MSRSVRVQLGAALDERAATGAGADTRRLMARAARAALRHVGARTAELSITLLDDAAIAHMNRQFLAHDGPTDVISFALFEAGEHPVGDIYIGFDQAVRQARENGVPLSEELARLAVHGTLHVLGHEHPAGRGRLESEMWQIQEQIISQVLAS
jgi:probable rRNA maturation factor